MSAALDQLKTLIGTEIANTGKVPEVVKITAQHYADLYVAQDREINFGMGVDHNNPEAGMISVMSIQATKIEIE